MSRESVIIRTSGHNVWVTHSFSITQQCMIHGSTNGKWFPLEHCESSCSITHLPAHFPSLLTLYNFSVASTFTTLFNYSFERYQNQALWFQPNGYICIIARGFQLKMREEEKKIILCKRAAEELLQCNNSTVVGTLEVHAWQRESTSSQWHSCSSPFGASFWFSSDICQSCCSAVAWMVVSGCTGGTPHSSSLTSSQINALWSSLNSQALRR